MRQYRLLTPASDDLASILAYLQQHSPAAAIRFLTGLDRRLNLLADFPESGYYRPEFRHDTLRYITFESYVITYLPSGKPLTVVAIVHGSRDLRSVLKSPDRQV